MTRLIMSALFTAAVISTSAPAFAGPFSDALHEAAQAGQITPHGVWDGK